MDASEATEFKSNAAAVIQTVERLSAISALDVAAGTSETASVLLVPKGKEVVSVKRFLDEWADAPDRRKGVARLTTLASFIEHVNRSKDKGSAVFADVSGSTPRLIAVIDYHWDADGGHNPRFCEHRAVYDFPLSKEWQAWTAAAKKERGLSQLEFAEFLEDRLLDVMDPDLMVEGEPAVGQTARRMAQALGIMLATPARLLELSRGLSVEVGHAVTAHHNVSTGEAQLSFSEEHKDKKGGPLKIPGGFVIGIPVFRDGVLYQLPVRLRYRVANQAVTWFVGLQRADVAFDDAVKATAETAQKSTNLPLFFGTPEV